MEKKHAIGFQEHDRNKVGTKQTVAKSLAALSVLKEFC